MILPTCIVGYFLVILGNISLFYGV